MQRFKALVQAQTTLLTVLPLLLGTIMAAYYYHHVNLGETFLLIFSAICFHLAVNGHNQLSDYRRYQNSTAAQNSTNNIIKCFDISIPWAYSVLAILLLLFAGSGLYLAYLSGWPLLLLGSLSFLVGYCYSGGPYPMSQIPLGELASGLAMGLNITLIGVYINIYNAPTYNNWFWLTGSIVTLPAVFTIANIMLANNICDKDEDVVIGRKTLAYYLGTKHSLTLLQANYVLSYLGLILSAVLGYLPWLVLLSLLTVKSDYQLVQGFVKAPDKVTTFPRNVLLFHKIVGLEVILGLLGLLL
ncbi:UbiA family prenyltransferase [Ligilactobacillus animalis]|uniref:UbiA family prenyltransferase n=1 Tax=Ligilactobacillus animalis TaxID=1605 RepID=UPI0008269049|nr:UbiA family prenyltransferase [Ligilactobacillus animalis]MDO5882993.1 UbiA family prenyltransferase [Ligilactobacillus animalis]MDU1486706.1 UbiA family prenyltransferase [Ligilactobacillus animalis]MDU8986738.1 UbiA family prenyltransferase [Ligilactobacillus animalis]OCX49534.1 1,4-dihydroxy-2-naphthoate prenyltransferase [Ligilactobacillus animalis]QHQ70672.1 prenyltransferase [Ligilactobacillus animalis]